MSDYSRKKSLSTIPSGSTGTRRHSRSSREQDSSGDSSVESRIDRHDRFRIGGPGNLPRWPLWTGPPLVTLPNNMATIAVDLAIDKLTRSGLEFERITICGRVSQGVTLRETDTTLLIKVSLEERFSEIVSLLDDMISALYGMGFSGRIEMIDPRAFNGPQTFPPSFTERQEDSWGLMLDNTIQFLNSLNIDWRQILPANRGYWRENSMPTVIVKADIPPNHMPKIPELEQIVNREDLQLEVSGTSGLWGLFGDDLAAAPEDNLIRTSLGWPFSRRFHSMGMSVERSFASSASSTIGGYLKIQSRDVEYTIGLTCYHGVREDEEGNANPNTDQKGSTDICLPCQSPSPRDIAIFEEPLQSDANKPIPAGMPAPTIAREEDHRQESTRKLEEIKSYNPFIGNVVAVSGWRNRSLENTLGSPYVFVDWACINIPKDQSPYALNDISDMARRLLSEYPEGAPFWKTDKYKVDSTAKFPETQVAIFKKGRATGLTVGTLGAILPEAHRIKGLPGHLHYRGFVVHRSGYRQFFSMPGDSGAWCLDGDGNVVGQIVGGDQDDGTAVIIPFSLVLQDIQDRLELQAGSITFP